MRMIVMISDHCRTTFRSSHFTRGRFLAEYNARQNNISRFIKFYATGSHLRFIDPKRNLKINFVWGLGAYSSECKA